MRLALLQIALLLVWGLSAQAAKTKNCPREFASLSRASRLQDKKKISLSSLKSAERIKLPDGQKISDLLDSRLGGVDSWPLRLHSERVFKELEVQWPSFVKSLPPGLVKKLDLKRLYLYLARFHKIGQSLAADASVKAQRYEQTLPILEKLNKFFDLTPEQALLTKVLAKSDVVDDVVRGTINPAQAEMKIRQAAAEAGLDPSSFFRLESFLHKLHIGTHPRLRPAFFISEDGSLISFRSPAYHELADRFGIPRDPVWQRWESEKRRAFTALDKEIPNVKRQAWDETRFSSPRNHDANQFRYLVHASTSETFFESFLRQKSLAAFDTIQMSVIDQDHTNTFGTVGVIINAPKSNIYSAYHSDMGSVASYNSQLVENPAKRFKENYQKFDLPPPELVLSKAYAPPTKSISKEQNHTEVVASGQDLAGNSLKISGVFVRVDSLGMPLVNNKFLEKITKLAEENQVPLVHVGPSKGYVTVRVQGTSPLATPEEFAKLQVLANSQGTKIIGVDKEFVTQVGVFEGDRLRMGADLPLPGPH